MFWSNIKSQVVWLTACMKNYVKEVLIHQKPVCVCVCVCVCVGGGGWGESLIKVYNKLSVLPCNVSQ